MPEQIEDITPYAIISYFSNINTDNGHHRWIPEREDNPNPFTQRNFLASQVSRIIAQTLLGHNFLTFLPLDPLSGLYYDTF